VTNRNTIRAAGFTLILGAATFNEWLLGAWFSPDGSIDSSTILWTIRVFQSLSTVAGMAFISSPGAIGRWLRRCGKGLNRLSRRPALILVLALLLGAGLRLSAIPAKNSIGHDEAYSYLAAVGKEAEFVRVTANQRFPYGTWATRDDWARFWSIDDWFPLQEIARGLAGHDVHPPLYFWLLHGAVLITGVQSWTGPVLNLLIFPLTLIALYWLGRESLRSRRWGALGALLWSVSPAVVYITLRARPYELYALWVVLYAALVVRCRRRHDPPGWPHYVFLYLVATAGLLTHYYFALVLAGGGMLFLFRRIQDRNCDGAAGVALLGAFATFVTAHPWFWGSFVVLSGKQSFTLSELFERALKTLWSFLSFFSLVTGANYVVLVGLIAALIFGAVKLWRRWKAPGEPGAVIDRRATPLMVFLAWTCGWVVLLYMAGVTPLHAMGPRYLALIWPFMALGIAWFVKSSSGCRGIEIVAGLGVFLLLSSGGFVVQQWARSRERAALVESRPVLIDTAYIGELPRIVRYLPAGSPVFAAHQHYLLARPERWLEGLGRRPAYISHPGYLGTEANREEILRMLRRHYIVEEVRTQGLGTTHLLRLRDGPR
jgi:hypothetical protein